MRIKPARARPGRPDLLRARRPARQPARDRPRGHLPRKRLADPVLRVRRRARSGERLVRASARLGPPPARRSRPVKPLKPSFQDTVFTLMGDCSGFAAWNNRAVRTSDLGGNDMLEWKPRFIARSSSLWLSCLIAASRAVTPSGSSTTGSGSRLRLGEEGVMPQRLTPIVVPVCLCGPRAPCSSQRASFATEPQRVDAPRRRRAARRLDAGEPLPGSDRRPEQRRRLALVRLRGQRDRALRLGGRCPRRLRGARPDPADRAPPADPDRLQRLRLRLPRPRSAAPSSASFTATGPTR